MMTAGFQPRNAIDPRLSARHALPSATERNEKYLITGCFSWQEWQGSNLRPPVLETGALPIELHSYGTRSPSLGTDLPWTPGWPVSRDGSSPGAHAAPAFNAATTHEMQEARRDGDRLSAPILPRLYSPSSLNDGWSAGRGPSGQWYFRSDSLIGRSLMLAMRTRIRPCSSNSQFSLP